MREARFPATFRHPNIPRAVAAFTCEDGQFIVMDFIGGQTAQEWAISHTPSPAGLILAIEGVFDALIHLHSHRPPVIHGDVEPANIIVMADMVSILVDFGLAIVLDESEGDARPSRGMAACWSALQQSDWASTDTRSDQYSLASTIYALITHRVPANSLERALGKGSLPPARSVNPAIPLNVEAALTRALSIRAEDRYPDIATFRHALIGES